MSQRLTYPHSEALRGRSGIPANRPHSDHQQRRPDAPRQPRPMPPRFEQPANSPSVPEMVRALNRAAWSIGDVAYDTSTGRVWVVSGTNSKNRIMAEGPHGRKSLVGGV